MNTKPAFRKVWITVFATVCLYAATAESMSRVAGETPVAVYNGVWKGQYKGRVFTVVALTPDDRGSLKGTIAIGKIQVGENGEVNEVTDEAEVPVPISDVQTKDGVLTFKAKDDDDLVGYHMKIAGADKAELQIDGAPMSMKPFKLERQAAQH